MSFKDLFPVIAIGALLFCAGFLFGRTSTIDEVERFAYVESTQGDKLTVLKFSRDGKTFERETLSVFELAKQVPTPLDEMFENNRYFYMKDQILTTCVVTDENGLDQLKWRPVFASQTEAEMSHIITSLRQVSVTSVLDGDDRARFVKKIEELERKVNEEKARSRMRGPG